MQFAYGIVVELLGNVSITATSTRLLADPLLNTRSTGFARYLPHLPAPWYKEDRPQLITSNTNADGLNLPDRLSFEY